MIIEDLRTIDGPNIHSYLPVVVMRVNLEGVANLNTKDMGHSFRVALLNILPGLREHGCSKGYNGGFVERLCEGTLLGHVIEHVALELQNIAGVGTTYGKTRYAGRESVYNIIFEYKAKEAAKQAARAALRLIAHLVEGSPFELTAELNSIKAMAAEEELGPSTKAIVKAALRRHIPVTRLGNNSLVQLGYGARAECVQATITGRTSCVAVDIACDKDLTKRLLYETGLPVPFGKTVTDVEKAVAFAQRLAYPVVLKPVDGNQGKGVSLNLTSEDEIRTAFFEARRYSEEVIVEQHVKGQHYRCTVINGRMVAASLRIPAHVIGDGVHSIRELVERENRNPNRGSGHEKPLTAITIDAIVKTVLKQQGLALHDVPAEGKCVFLRQNANISTGGIARDVTDIVHPDNRWLVERSVEVVGLDIAGVDCVLTDINRSYRKQNAAIIEINAAPGIRMHHYPATGKSRDVASSIVDYLFPSHNGRIPIVTVTGTNGKTTTVRLLARILRGEFGKIGFTSSDGVFINDECVFWGDATGPLSTRTILTDKQVEAAVLEIARGGLIRGGLAYDESDVAVVTNISNDHLGQDGVESVEDLMYVKALTVEVVRPDGYVVLNADSSSCSFFAQRARGKIVYFSKYSDSAVVSRHLGIGGKAVFCKDGMVVLAEGDKAEPLLRIDNIPIAFGGIAQHNLENALAAISAGWSLGVSVADILQGVQSFMPSLEHNPGRQNIVDLGDQKQLILDYAHNSEGYRSIVHLARQIAKGRVTGIICAPGDRLDKDIIQLGELAGRSFDRLYIKEDRCKRGRRPGEVAQLLYQGCLNVGAEAVTELAECEEHAILAALKTSEPGETIVLLYEKLDECLTILAKHSVLNVRKGHTGVIAVAST